MKQFLCALIFGFVGSLPNATANPLKTSKDFDSLPLAIQIYVLDLGFKSGLQNPGDISLDEEHYFSIKVADSDLNLDDEPDFFVTDCMIVPAESPSQFQANGFPCSSGTLMLSTRGHLYTFLRTGGTLLNATAGKVPKVTIAQRNYKMCGAKAYMCNATYSIRTDDLEKYYLKLEKAVPGD